MNWASKQHNDLPNFSQLAIDKSSVADEQAFFDYVALCGLHVAHIEPDYYILDGDQCDLEIFSEYWAI